MQAERQFKMEKKEGEENNIDECFESPVHLVWVHLLLNQFAHKKYINLFSNRDKLHTLAQFSLKLAYEFDGLFSLFWDRFRCRENKF